jgi:hypothetical protein
MRCLMIELRESEIDSLVRQGYLAPDNRGRNSAVIPALYAFLEEALR